MAEKGSRWFRSHARKLNSPKVQRLSDKLYRAWDSLLCVACESGGKLAPIADTAFLLRKSEKETQALIDELIARDFFVKTETGIEPKDWSEWQYKSDVSTDRVKRFRERQGNVSETPSESEAETDTESEEEIIRAFALFNDATKRTNWPAAQKLDAKRKRRLRDRLTEVGGIEGFALVLAKAEGSEFLTVKWPNFNLDWMLKPENFTKLQEGNYDNKTVKGAASTVAAPASADDWRWRVDWHRTKGMWNPGWGPEPGQPGCFVPKELLQ